MFVSPVLLKQGSRSRVVAVYQAGENEGGWDRRRGCNIFLEVEIRGMMGRVVPEGGLGCVFLTSTKSGIYALSIFCTGSR